MRRHLLVVSEKKITMLKIFVIALSIIGGATILLADNPPILQTCT